MIAGSTLLDASLALSSPWNHGDGGVRLGALSSIMLSKLALRTIQNMSMSTSLYYPLLAPHNGTDASPGLPYNLDGPIDPRCPHRYLVVNSQNYGRHHNQLQGLMNSIIWSNKPGTGPLGEPLLFLNRTVVLTWFYWRGWIESRLFYNFNLIAAHYCIISEAGMLARIKEHYGAQRAADGQPSLPVTSECLRDRLSTLPLHKTSKGIIMECVEDSVDYTRYDERYGFEITRNFLLHHVAPSTATVLVIGAQLAFYMRPDLPSLAAAFRLLRPSVVVERIINNMVMKLPPATRTALFHAESLDWGVPLHAVPSLVVGDSAGPYYNLNLQSPLVRRIAKEHRMMPYYYVGVHSRSRERTCVEFLKGMRHDIGSWLPRVLEDDVWKISNIQCRLTVPYIEKVLGGLSKETHLFLASDGQHPALINQLSQKISKGLVKWEDSNVFEAIDSVLGNHSNADLLYGLAADFFLLTRARAYTGNQLSTVSQNVCYVRLGNGLSCDGVIPAITLYHARSILY